jgi:hypothetical protein
LVCETKTIGHATAIAAVFNFNVQITATQEQESEELQQRYSSMSVEMVI